jgi:hypothetical protein
MGLPRFKPSAVCANPRHFGRVKTPRWANPNPLDETQTAWAIYQHRAALAVFEEMEAAQQTPDDLAVGLNEDAAWLKRKLYGQTPADIGDLMKWALRYGISVLPAIDSSNDLVIKPIDLK